jgi:hypothetical protein
VIRTTDTNLQVALQSIQQLTTQATTTLTETGELMRATGPVMQQLPTVLLTTDVALQSITRLTDQVSQSWLLGGGARTINPLPASASHPHDDDAYNFSSSTDAVPEPPAPPISIDSGVTGEP